WHFPWGCPRRALPGTVFPWSPDFPPAAQAPPAAIRPAGAGTHRHTAPFRQMRAFVVAGKAVYGRLRSGIEHMVIRVVSAVIVMLAATSAFAQERQWVFDTNDEDAFLTFGVPETDDVGISFWCKIQSGEARVFLPEAGEELKPGKKVKITFNV